jgi:uncharacterized membrane protein YhfC
MPSALFVNTGWLMSTAIATLFVILYPVVLAIIANRRLKVSWRYAGYGVLIFFLFQMISRVPLVIWLQNLFAPALNASATLRFSWIAVLALSAGLFEEIGRYVAYRWLMRREEKTWRKAIMYGIGHGGLESILLVGGQLLLTLINLMTVIFLLRTNAKVFSASQLALIERQIAAINAQPAWTPLLAAWERLWTVPVQIALSVVVLQVFRRGNIAWLWLAILAHAVVDFIAVVIPEMLGASLQTSLIVEGIVAIFGLMSIWVIWKLRDPAEAAPSEGVPPTETAPAS